MGKLVLVRHGESVWNVKGMWTGWTDVDLTEKGREQARKAGDALKDISFSIAFTPPLLRTTHTLDEIRNQLNNKTFNEEIAKQIIERDYGDLTGKNKWEVEKEFGEKQFIAWRRGWGTRPPNGESLKDVYERVIPFYKSHILQRLISGENVLVVSSGNTIRALIKYIEHISDTDIEHVELKTGEVYEYFIDENGNVLDKKILVTNTKPGKQ